MEPDPAAEPPVGAAAEPTVGAAAEPVVEPPVGAAAEPVVELPVGAAAGPVVDVAPEPPVDVVGEPVAVAATGAVVDGAAADGAAADGAAVEGLAEMIAANRTRQRELYGMPLGSRVRRLTGALGVTQARLARTLGMSPAMLSQLVSARRVKIGDPTVLARLLLLDQRCADVGGTPLPRRSADALLAEAARARWEWSPSAGGPATTTRPVPRAEPHRDPGRASAAGPTAAEALRRIAAPARLAAAAAALGPGFPELAEVLRQAAARPH